MDEKKLMGKRETQEIAGNDRGFTRVWSRIQEDWTHQWDVMLEKWDNAHA